MSGPENHLTEMGGLPIHWAISIPGNAADAGHGAGLGATLRELLTAAGAKVSSRPQTVAILESVPGLTPGTIRPGFVVASPRVAGTDPVASDFSTHGHPVAAGDSWYEPSRNSIDLYVRSLTASPVVALAVVYP